MKSTVFLIIIAFIVLLSVWLILKRKCTVEVEATVVYIDEQLSPSRHGRKIKVYQPTFVYEWDGFERTLRPLSWSSTHRFQAGDKVKLLIDPDDPGNFRYRYISQEPIVQMGLITLFGVLLVAMLSKR